MKTMTFGVDDAGVALLTLDVPGRPVNVLTPELEAELADVVARVAGDGAVRGLVITSAKRGSFLAGADLRDLAEAYGRETVEQAYARSARLSGLFRRLETCGKPVAAAVNGAALGGGLELCLAAHYRVLVDEPSATVGLPEVKVGLLPGAGGTQRLPRLVGIARALPLMLEGEPVPPARALELGIVHALAPADRLVEQARAWVLATPGAMQPWDTKAFAVPGGVGCLAPHAVQSFQLGTARVAATTQRNYPAPPAILAAVFEGTIVPIDAGLDIESMLFAKLSTGPVARNLMRTFLSQRAAGKLPRRPAAVPKFEATKLGVIGAGMMGAGVAHVAAAAGVEVVLLDRTRALAEAGKARSYALVRKSLEGGRLSPAEADARVERITATDDFALLAGCDLVVEAVFEDRALKHEVAGRAAAVVGPDAVFATNTSTLPIAGLAAAYPWPERFVGMHFFSPVDRMPLVEIIRGRATGHTALAAALDFAARLGKTSVVVNDSPGFFTSRVFGAYVDEGMAMLAEGVEPALIENAAKTAGMPVGPLAIADEVSLTLQLEVHRQAVADDLPERFRRLTAIGVVRTMVEGLGRPGRGGGGGFYDYPAPGPGGAGRKALWPGLREAFPPAAEAADVEWLRWRLLGIQALEAARCYEEGVVEHPADADLGSLLGIGFPRWAGGALSYIETVGPAEFVARCERLAARHGPRFAPNAQLVELARAGRGFYAAGGEHFVTP
jgi:3-hydroxyacyl-CoA dehydrogenase / enoyl-CoA hydratase / 3-hydroxybutyryl-CoA epimerase